MPDSVSTSSVSAFPKPSSAACTRRTAMSTDAGTAANTKNRGPQVIPPYHAHHFA